MVASGVVVEKLSHICIYMLAKVYKVSLWLGRFKAATAKRITLWSSTPRISGFWSNKKFNLKQFRKTQQRRKKALQPTIAYVDSEGKRRWKGTKDLTKTGSLGLYVEQLYGTCSYCPQQNSMCRLRAALMLLKIDRPYTCNQALEPFPSSSFDPAICWT